MSCWCKRQTPNFLRFDQIMLPRLAYLTDGKEFMALEAQRNYRVRFWILPTIMQTQWYLATEHPEQLGWQEGRGDTTAHRQTRD